MKKCFFCNISNKIENTEIIFETGNFYVMLNEHKITRAGAICMIVSKNHIPYIYDLPTDMRAELMNTIVLTANLLRQTYNAKGTRIWIKNGKEAGQTIEHLHFHIMPANSFWDFPLLLLKLGLNIFEGFFLKRRKIPALKLKLFADQLRSNLK